MKRRDFIKTAGAAAGIIAFLGGLGMGVRGTTKVHSLTANGFPGRVVPLNHRKIAKPGRWQG